MKRLLRKWWILVLIVLFVLINLFVNDLKEHDQDKSPMNRDVLEEGNINTH